MRGENWRFGRFSILTSCRPPNRWISGGLTAKLEALGVAMAFAQADAVDLDEARAGFRARVLRNADTRVRDVMLKVKGTIDMDADLMDALELIYRNKITVLPVYEGKKLVGVVRESDLFLTVADILGGQT